MAKKITISSLGNRMDKMDIEDVEDFLKQEFKSTKQLVLAIYYNGSPKSLEDLNYEELEECAAFKPVMKLQPLSMTTT